MKITNIEIKNFRAFPKSYQINLYNAGKNLLVYGENGSGKSSLYFALKYFFESGVDENIEDKKNTAFENHQNIFTEDPGCVKLRFRSEPRLEKDTYEWSRDAKETTDELIIEISKASGFLDYKDLLGVHYLQPEGESVNVFNLLVEVLIEEFCDRRHLHVKYYRAPNKQDSQDFWDAIKIENKRRVEKQNPALLDQRLINEIELYRSRILNPLSHANIVNIYRKEIEEAIKAVEELETALA